MTEIEPSLAPLIHKHFHLLVSPANTSTDANAITTTYSETISTTATSTKGKEKICFKSIVAHEEILPRGDTCVFPSHLKKLLLQSL